MEKNIKKGIVVVCLMAAIGGICYYVAKPRTTRSKQEEVQQIVEPTRESQAKPEAQSTTDNTNKVEASQPRIESYNDSIAPTHESEGATEATTTTGTTYNKVVAEDNEAAIKAADEEIRQASENGAIIVEDQDTGVTAVTETQPAPAEEEEESTQKRVDLDISQAVDAVNEK